jgi:hypothetical protein
MAQNYTPVPLDQAPIPQLPVPDYKPAQLTPQPQDPGIGYAGKTGKVADIAGNFLQGFVQGKQNAAAMKIKKENQNMSAAWNSFQNDQAKAAEIYNDPNSTPEQKQQADLTRKKSYEGYLAVLQPYVEPDKKTNSKGKQQSGMKDHLKAAFGIDDPHVISQAAFAMAKNSGPPPLPAKSSQDRLADLQYADSQKVDKAIDALAEARKNNAPPDQIAKLEQNVRDLSGKIDSPKEKQDNALAQAAADERAGKPINDATKKQLQAAGYDPAPVMPGMFQRIDPQGIMWVDSVDPNTGKLLGSTKVGGTRVPPDQKKEAQDIFKQNLDNLGDLLKKAHPDWTQQQISQEQAKAMLSGQFGVKVVPGMTVAQTQKASSEAVRNAIYGALDDDERNQASKYGLFGEKNGTYSLTSDLSKAGGMSGFLNVISLGSAGMTTDQAKALDTKVRDGARNWLAHQVDDSGGRRYTDEQIDQMIPSSIDDAKKQFNPQGLSPTPDNPNAGGGNSAKKSDVTAFAKANNMSYDDAVKVLKSQGYNKIVDDQ